MDGNGIKELKAWIEKNKELATYTTQEIVDLAIACGFQRSAIAQWQTQKKFKEAV